MTNLAAETFTQLRTVPRGGLAPWQLKRVKDYIESNLAADLKLRELTAIPQLSRSHFARAFKDSTGVPPHAYVVHRRLERAKALMLSTDDTLCRIALECGLADQAHFSNLFRRHVGVTPTEWRRRARPRDLSIPRRALPR